MQDEGCPLDESTLSCKRLQDPLWRRKRVPIVDPCKGCDSGGMGIPGQTTWRMLGPAGVLPH